MNDEVRHSGVGRTKTENQTWEPVSHQTLVALQALPWQVRDKTTVGLDPDLNFCARLLGGMGLMAVLPLLSHQTPIFKKLDTDAFINPVISPNFCVLPPELDNSGNVTFLEDCPGLDRYPTVPMIYHRRKSRKQNIS